MEKTTDINFILDRSGSMHRIKDDTIGGFNSFLKDQKENDSSTTVSLIQFDTHYEKVYTDIPIQDVDYLNDNTFKPRGATALLDAIGRTITKTKKRLVETNRLNTSQVVFVILTDGYENASRKYSLKEIFHMIRKYEEKYGWQFVFIGTNQDAIAEARKMGIERDRALEFKFHKKGVDGAFNSLSDKMNRYKRRQSSKFSFDEEDRKKQEDDFEDTASLF